MRKIIKKILKEQDLLKFVVNIKEHENNNIFFQKIYHIKLKNTETMSIILNAYNKNEFSKNDYEKDIKDQINDQKYLLENLEG